jgi:DNA ligase (NAD+)
VSKQIELFSDNIDNADEKKEINEIKTLTEKLLLYQHEYYVLNRPSVSDSFYDSLFDRLLFLEKKYPSHASGNSPVKRVGSDISAELPEVKHTIPVLSLDKLYTVDELNKWIEKLEKNSGSETVITIEEKIDGISIVLYYEKGILKRAVTRGNGVTGNDVTNNVMTIGSVPLRLGEPVDAAVRGEIYLPLKNFNEINDLLDVKYANPRNLAAGTIRRLKSSEVKKVPLNIFVYEGFFPDISLNNYHEIRHKLQQLGFRTNKRIKAFTDSGAKKNEIGKIIPAGNLSEIIPYIENAIEERKSLDYEIDGLVVKLNNIESRNALGYTGHHPRWAVAYKFESSEAESVVKSIDLQIGRTGRATPVARIEPVEISGSVVSNVTLHNQDYINFLSLAPGDRVTVSRRGDVIPAIENVVDKNSKDELAWKMPETCPFCGTKLETEGAHSFCKNRSCPERVKGRILFFASRDQMNIENLGIETIELLAREKIVTDFYDIYEKDMGQLENYEGYGAKKINLIKTGIENSKKNSFQTVLSSLGIPDIGPKVSELLIKSGYNSIEKIFDLAQTRNNDLLLEINGIGVKTAESFFKYFNDQETINTIIRLAKNGLSMSESVPEESSEEQIFRGQYWCVTGSFEKFTPRSIAEEIIKKRGGSVAGQVSGKTTHLLCGASPGSKYDKALELGVEIVTEEAFLKLISR